MSNGCVHSGYNAKNFTATNRALLNITIPTNAILCLTREQSSRTPVNSSNPQKQRRKKKQQQKKVFCFVSYQHGVTSMQCNATPLFFFRIWIIASFTVAIGSLCTYNFPQVKCACNLSISGWPVAKLAGKTAHEKLHFKAPFQLVKVGRTIKIQNVAKTL